MGTSAPNSPCPPPRLWGAPTGPLQRVWVTGSSPGRPARGCTGESDTALRGASRVSSLSPVGVCVPVCVEVPSETEAVQGAPMKLRCISCMKREEVEASTVVEWFYRPEGGKDFLVRPMLGGCARLPRPGSWTRRRAGHCSGPPWVAGGRWAGAPRSLTSSCMSQEEVQETTLKARRLWSLLWLRSLH